jgi:hypothetical protein
MGSAGAVLPRIFIPRVPDEITERDVTQHFSAFGEVKDVYLPKFPGGGRKGIGYVGLATMEAAHRAVAAVTANPFINNIRIGEPTIAAPKEGDGARGPPRR